MLKGYKTQIAALIGVVVGALEAADWLHILGNEQKAGLAVLIISVVAMVVRHYAKDEAASKKIAAKINEMKK